jgi:hypothetical protein
VLIMSGETLSQHSLSTRKKGFINKNGVEVIAPQYYEVSDFSEGLAAVAKKANSPYGYIDTKGNVVLAPLYDEALPFSEGLAAVKRQGQWSFITRTGTVRLKTTCSTVGSFHNGLAACSSEDARIGFINRQGKLVIPQRYSYSPSQPCLFSNGLAAVVTPQGAGYINTTGRTLVQPVYESAQPFYDGLAAVKFKGKWGYLKQPAAK